MKKRKYLPLYKEWMAKGCFPVRHCNGNTGGLCGIFDKDKLFQLLKPASSEELTTTKMYGFWGLDGETCYEHDRQNSFESLRQNIVLFMAAMNNEL